MRRRHLIAIMAGIAAWPLAAHAQQAPPASTDISSCAHHPDGFPQRVDGPRWNGWGADISNSRFQPAAMAGLTPEQVPRLHLKWAFGFPGAASANAQPTIVGGLLFVGGGDRKVYALDAKSGCTRWTFATEAVVRTAISVGPISGTDQFAAFFGDVHATAYAVNATSGALMWKAKVEDHPAARIVGAPALYDSVLYVPVSSFEEATGSAPKYQCCTFRGSVVALDSATGRQIWKAYTIPEAPRPTSRNAIGTQLYGPAGAAVWSAPTIDVQRHAVYVATGNSYSDPPADTSDAILAFDLATGRMLWHRQATAKDSFVVSCAGGDPTNCPKDHGPDSDFGQSPILVRLRDGQRVLVVGQKSGVVYALDPIRKARSCGKRGVPCGDRSQCSPALSAAVTAIPGVVFSGGVSGYLRAYATADARLLWEVDTARDYATVNDVSANGGAIDGPGPTIVDGMLYATSGYAQWGGLPGNVLLAFEAGNP